MPIVTWPSQMAPLVPQLRRLQYAANMLNYHEFCEAVGWERDDYSKAKFLEFQKLGRLHVFDNHVLEAAVEYYEKLTAAHVECDCGPAGSVYGQHADNCALKVARNA